MSSTLLRLNNPLRPILLYDDKCAVCCRIANWVMASAHSKLAGTSLWVRPIGVDPRNLLALNSHLNIWDAYATIHIVMPDGSLKQGGQAVAEVFRNLPSTRWIAKLFSIQLFGFSPFQKILDGAYLVLSDIRPLLGCKSCGAPKAWVKPIHSSLKWIQTKWNLTTRARW